MSGPDDESGAGGGATPNGGLTLPRWLDPAFAVLSVGLAVLVAIALGRELERPPLAEQRLVPALGVVDRCEQCHATESHPGELLASHPPERFGCTPCHGGQGWAVTSDAAHRAQPDWERPLFTPAEREAACGRCHVGGALAGAEQLSRGRAAIERLGCVACHALPDAAPPVGMPSRPGASSRPAGRFTAEVSIGPELDGLRDQTEPGWVRAWLRDPFLLDPRHRMPRFRLDDDNIEALVAYLFTLPGPALQTLPPGGDADRGRVAIAQRRCATCHLIEGRGGTTAVSLDHIGAKLRPEWLFNLLTGTHRLRPTTAMPDFRLPAGEAADIVAYAAEQLVPDTAEPPWAAARGPAVAAKAEQGERLFAELGCGGCHGLAGRRFERIGVPLAELGARRVSELPRAVGAAPASDVPAWIATKLRTPTAFDVAGAAPAQMPTFRLAENEAAAEREAAAVGVAIASFSRRLTHPDYRRTAAPVYGPPAGEIARLFERFRCLVCHRIAGVGGDVSGIPLDGAGSRLARPWLAAFLREPVTIRMNQPERMPVLGLTTAESEDLAAYIGLELTDARVPAEPETPAPPETPGTTKPAPPEAVAASAVGQELFRARGCSTCHVVGAIGEMKGPTLDISATRLRRPYVRAMLVEPALVPLGRHGEVRLTAAEADAVVTWLWSLPARP